MAKIAILSREELYEKVWSTPMTKLAQEYVLSDQGLAKKCKKHQIPRPPMGYWQKLKARKKMTRTPLPSVDDPQLQSIEIDVSVSGCRINADFLNISIGADDPRLEIARDFQLPEKISRYHPLVKTSRATLNPNNSDRYGFLTYSYLKPPILGLKITKQTFQRAHRLMHALITIFDKIGWEVTIEGSRESRNVATIIKVGEEKLKIQLKEKVRRIEHVLTEKNKIEKARRQYYSHDKYDYVSTGVLSLKITNIYGQQRQRTQWSDTKNVQIEQNLEEIVKGFIIGAEAHKRDRLKREEQHRRWEEEKLKEKECQRIKQIEENRTALLFKYSEEWHQSEKVHQFINAIRNDLEVRKVTISPELENWVQWAEAVLKNQNPLFQLDEITFMHNKISNDRYSLGLY